MNNPAYKQEAATQLDTAMLNPRVWAEIREYISANNIKAEVQELTAREALEYWLQWNGIINWTDQIIEAFETIREAEQSIIRRNRSATLLKADTDRN